MSFAWGRGKEKCRGQYDQGTEEHVSEARRKRSKTAKITSKQQQLPERGWAKMEETRKKKDGSVQAWVLTMR
eukprot:5756264-Amphidinium_carterae.1